MPYFRFRGIDVFGSMHKGRLSAPTKERLRRNLLTRGIVLLSAKPLLLFPFSRTMRAREIILFYQTVAELLHAGVLLPDALISIAENSSRVFFQDTVHKVAQKVISGKSFVAAVTDTAFGQKTALFLLQAGQESGNIQRACEAIATYLAWKENTKKTILSLLIMPMLTCAAIMVLLCAMSHLLVPRMLDMFRLLQNTKAAAQLEHSVIFNIIRIFSVSFFISVFFGCIIFGLIMWLWNRTTRGNTVFIHIILKTPYVKSMYLYVTVSKFFFTLSLLLQNGVSTAKSLELISQFTPQIPIRQKIAALAHRVKGGEKFSIAFFDVFEFHDAYTMLLLHTAEKTGSIQRACTNIAEHFTVHIQSKASNFLALLQPFFVLCVGILIAGLMVALYSPIAQFSLSI